MSDFKNKKIVLGITGGIAAYKVCALTSSLRQAGAQVKVVMTRSSTKLVGPLSFQALSGYEVLTDKKAFSSDHGMDHIEWSKWADVVLIAPCTANMLAKIANGIGDDVLSTLVLAYEGKLLLAPSMNPIMWRQPSVQRNLKRCEDDGRIVIMPEDGAMACGDDGEGRLPNESVLLDRLTQQLK